MTETLQEKYELVITADSISSSDERFTMKNLALGDHYKPLDSYFKKADGNLVRRQFNKGERKNSNQTLARLAFQVFEDKLAALPIEELEDFPICQYRLDSEIIRGIFPSVDAFKKVRNTIEFLVYRGEKERTFVIYSWNIFSTIVFVQECLKRFGETGEQFVLTYREKVKKEAEINEKEVLVVDEAIQEFKGYLNPYSEKLMESKNIIFRGAPGTGKSYLAKEIAADIISNGYFDEYTLLTDEQKQQVEFVQFHPSYDYSDFVEGLRPKTNADGSMGFELQDGVFTRFVAKAKKKWEDAQKTSEEIKNEFIAQEVLTNFFSRIEMGEYSFKTSNGTTFYLMSVDDQYIHISIPENKVYNSLKLKRNELYDMLVSGRVFNQVKDITRFFGKINATQEYSYNLAIFKEIQSSKVSVIESSPNQIKLKPYIFIIDEINRGEISKIFGELFFAIDPGYRGKAGEVSTQYANLHDDPNAKFYIPENVYIIGTMNDIDRSVDSFDFAMRRRFRFLEIKADERLEMLECLGEELKEEAIIRMSNLNQAISNVEELNENYHIGASYFLKLKTMSFDTLWLDYLHPLLQDYIRGMYDEVAIMKSFEDAYTSTIPKVGEDNAYA